MQHQQEQHPEKQPAVGTQGESLSDTGAPSSAPQGDAVGQDSGHKLEAIPLNAATPDTARADATDEGAEKKTEGAADDIAETLRHQKADVDQTLLVGVGSVF